MTQTKAHAVLIGVDDYSTYDATNKHNLLGCVNDVRAFWDVCVTSGFAPENIHVLTNPPIDPAELGGLAANFKSATRANILAEQEALVDRLRTDARAVGLLVYSGHGAWIDDASENSAVICPSDFWMDLARPNNDIPVHHLWKGGGSNLTVVLDCCHSGGRSRHAGHPIMPRDPHRKHLPTAQARDASQGTSPSNAVSPDPCSPAQASRNPAPPRKGIDLETFAPLRGKNLAQVGLMPIGSAVPLTLTSRTLTEADRKHSPYLDTERTLRGTRVLSACDVHEAAYQAEFAGRFHGALTWAVTSTVGQWRVDEAEDGAIRTTIGCGSVKRHAASLLQVFSFQQTPVFHPASATNLPFFGVAGPISETPTGDVLPLEIDPNVKNLKLTLISDNEPHGYESKLEIDGLTESWSLGVDFMRELAATSESSHSALAFAVSDTLATPPSPVTAFQMPTDVDWGTAVSAPTGPAFYSMSGAGPAVVAMAFQLDTRSSPMRVTAIDWYQGVVGSRPNTYAITRPGRDFTFAGRLPTPPSGLTWFHARVKPL